MKTLALILVITFSLEARSVASWPRGCALEKQISQRPSAGALNAIGTHFAAKKLRDCSIAAFRKALEIDPHYWRANLNLGLAYLSEGRNARAVESLRRAAEEEPYLAEVHRGLGAALEALGKMSEAQAQFEIVLALEPASTSALFNRGVTLAAQGRYVAAIASYQQALNLSPENIECSCAMADAYVKNGNADRASMILQSLTKAHPDSAVAWYNLGVVYARQQNYDAAVNALRTSLSLNSHNENTRRLLARTLIDALRYQEALPLVNDLVKRSPTNPEYRCLQGLIYRGEGEFQQAVVYLSKAATRDPDNFDVEYNLGFCLARTGRTKEAEERFKKALTIRPGSTDATYQLMLAFRRLGSADLAEEIAKQLQAAKLATVNRDLGNTFGDKANKLAEAGNYEEAIEQYKLALGLDPKNAETVYNLSVSQDKAGDLVGEKSSLLRALELNPHLGVAHDALGVILLKQGLESAAQNQFEQGIEYDPQCASCKVHLASILSKTGGVDRAMELLRQTVADAPDSGESHRKLGMLLASAGNFPEACRQLMRAVTLNPKDVDSLTDLGMIQGKMLDPRAVDTLERVVNLQPGSAEAHLNLGIALADRNRQKAALAQFSEAVQLAPGDARAYYNEGRVLIDLKRFQEARVELEKACRLRRTLPHARYYLALAEAKCGDPSAALGSLKDLAASGSMNADSYLLLGQTLENLGQMPDAIEAWKKVLELRPQSPGALYKLFRDLRKSDPSLSASYLAKFKSANEAQQRQSQANALASMGSKVARMGNWQQAISDFEGALHMCGNCDLAWQMTRDLGLSLCKAGDLVRCRKELLIALKQKPDDPETMRALGLIARSRAKVVPSAH